MREKSNPSRLIDLNTDRFTQVGDSQCGPAVIQMRLHTLGIEVAQAAVAEAGAAPDLIEQHGMRIDQLARAVRQLAPKTRFWYKDYSLIEDLVRIVADYDDYVGIEWQGLFEDTLEDETNDGDYGHYSVITTADPISRKLVIADHYKDFRSQDRVIPFAFFLSRWGDTIEVPDPLTGTDRLVEDRQMMFLITPAEETFPRLLGMKEA